MMVAILAVAGAHWTVLQSVAWTTMLASNLRTDSFTEAVERTFDGKHPCPLCQAIAKGKKTEKKTEFSIPLKKLEFVSERVAFVFSPPSQFQLLPERDFFLSKTAHKPLLPPPRLFPA